MISAIFSAAYLWNREPEPPNPATFQIAASDTLASVFARIGIGDHDLLAIMEAGRGAAFRVPLQEGGQIRVTRSADGRLHELLVGHGNEGTTAFTARDRTWFEVTHQPATAALEPRIDRPQSPSEPARSATSPAPDDSNPGDSDQPEVARTAPAPDSGRRTVKVRNGDSLYLIFKRHGLPQTDLAALLESGREGKRLRRIRPGQSISFELANDGRIARLDHEQSKLSTASFRRSGDGYSVETITREYERHLTSATGQIESSLFAAAEGVSDKVIHQLVSILGWDIDFARDLLRGDTFAILYEQLHLDGRRIRDGNISAVEFRAQRLEKPVRAYRYTDSKNRTDYYDPEGRPLRSAFTRNPVQYTRISSRFSKARRHPILNKVRPHRGVDYAAPRGTPVRATGSGVVEFAGRKGGFGKTIILDHGQSQTTLYAHLSRYAKGIKRNARVRQGQVVGYVGSTGLSTGPHLHYEFRIDGVHRDPLKVKLPRAAPLDKPEMTRFREKIGSLVARLDVLGATRLASLNHQ